METFLRLQRLNPDQRHIQARTIRFYIGPINKKIFLRGRLEQETASVVPSRSKRAMKSVYECRSYRSYVAGLRHSVSDIKEYLRASVESNLPVSTVWVAILSKRIGKREAQAFLKTLK